MTHRDFGASPTPAPAPTITFTLAGRSFEASGTADPAAMAAVTAVPALAPADDPMHAPGLRLLLTACIYYICASIDDPASFVELVADGLVDDDRIGEVFGWLVDQHRGAIEETSSLMSSLPAPTDDPVVAQARDVIERMGVGEIG